MITAPVSERANRVLANLLEECRIVDGKWDRHQGDPGCVELYSSLFGFRAGLRREREDLIAIGRTAAQVEFGKLAANAGRLLTGRGLDMADLVGMPALMVSGTAGGNSRDYAIFTTTLQWFLVSMDDSNFDDVQAMGTAYILAEVYRFEPRHEAVWIERARKLAGRLESGGSIHCFGALAWASIARATGDASDLNKARKLALSQAPRFSRSGRGTSFEGPYGEYLSAHLMLADAACDLAIMEPSGPWHRMATEIVEYVFSDAYFNGRFLAHDLEDGKQSPEFCTGCNYHALYLADRVYGDTLRLDPVPPLRVVRSRPTTTQP